MLNNTAASNRRSRLENTYLLNGPRGAANKKCVFRWWSDSITNKQLEPGASNFVWRSIVKVLTSSPTNQPTFMWNSPAANALFLS
jgi:hypothetical protein